MININSNNNNARCWDKVLRTFLLKIAATAKKMADIK
jgi:hypothetical protein